MMLERRVGAGVPAGLLVALCACTVPAAQSPDAPRATLAREVSGWCLACEVPFAAGTAEIVESGLIGEFSRFPQGRWVVQVTVGRVRTAGDTIRAAEGELAAAGYRRVASAGSMPASAVRMRREGTTVLVRVPRRMPWVIEYTVTRPITGCPAGPCHDAP